MSQHPVIPVMFLHILHCSGGVKYMSLNVASSLHLPNRSRSVHLHYDNTRQLTLPLNLRDSSKLNLKIIFHIYLRLSCLLSSVVFIGAGLSV